VRKISAIVAPVMVTVMLLSGAGSTEGVQAPNVSSETPVVQLSEESHELAAKKRRKKRRRPLVVADPATLPEWKQHNRNLAHAAMLERWGEDQWHCLDLLWGMLDYGGMLEGGWDHFSRGGIVQARPPSKMAAQGPDWRENPDTQIRYGLFHYIAVDKRFARYGNNPCGALQFRLKNGYY
jgi:hypothetical protein